MNKEYCEIFPDFNKDMLITYGGRHTNKSYLSLIKFIKDNIENFNVDDVLIVKSEYYEFICELIENNYNLFCLEVHKSDNLPKGVNAIIMPRLKMFEENNYGI
jgi:hypothetical protein